MSGQQMSKNSKPAAAEASQNSSAIRTVKTGLAASVGRQFDKLAATPLEPGLYIVSTPIGNLADISIRALFVLASADAVFCEDTRHSRKLLAAYAIGRKLEAYHDFSGDAARARILAALRQGKSVALISDAGTPLVADPGFKLVRGAIEEGSGVFAIPGPSAILAALVSAGLPTDQFHFGGFLPPKEAARRHELEAARAIPGTLVYYESGGRLKETVECLAEIYPGRPVAIARELTKLFEAILRGTASEILEEIRDNPPAGEFVILIGAGEAKPPANEDIENALRNAMRRVSLKEAVEEVAKGLGAGRKQVYNLALQLRVRAMAARNRHGSSGPTSHAIGVAAENWARGLLEGKDYRILAQRYKTKGGEIDLVAKRGDHLAFVEVKRRKTEEEAAYAIQPRQQARIAAAAEVFLGEHSELAHCSASFDVILVTPSQGCAHIEQAFLA